MWYIPVLLGICLALIAYFALRRPKSPPAEVYVCTECGQRDCICHRQEPT